MSPTNYAMEPADEGLRDEPILSENSRKVLEARYLKKDESGACIETSGRLFRRVARTVADVELTYGADRTERQAWEDRFYQLMTSWKFMPNSPTLMNAGREMGMLSACFVLPVRDSIVDIFDSIKHTALIQKAGGGTGFAFDELRPTGDYIQSSGGTTSGPISFWRAFSEATNAIQQGAFRRGANMGMMYIHHPDILKFLHAKEDLEQFTNYNISVKVTDTWMEEYQAHPDSPHVVRNPRDGKAYVIPRDVGVWKYDMRSLVEVTGVEPVSPGSREKYYTSPRLTGPLPAELRDQVYTKRQIWDIIVDNAWKTGEPGVVFIDRINQHNPTPQLGRIEATNPCGEQPLLPYEACNLGSINLGRFVRNPCTPQADVDWEGLRGAVHLSTRFLDDVIDANNYPLPEIDQICKANRKIGLGIMGFADALFQLGVAYNSEEGAAWGERFMAFVNDQAHQQSESLARTRGCFPNWEGSTWQTQHNRPMRNAAVTTVAPTGTISIIANCSGGIEPLFSLAFIRNVLRGQKQGERPLVEVNDTFRKVAGQRGFLSEELLERLGSEGSLAEIAGVPEDVRRVFVCAHDITPQWHMRMQAAFQRHCDSSISKTINFPHDATRQEVERIYRLAFELGCKGVTVYRNGCRDCQPMALKNRQETQQKADASDHDGDGDGQSEGAQCQGVGQQAAAAAPVIDHAPVPTTTATAAPAPAPAEAPPPHKWIEPRDLPQIVSGLRIRQLTPFGNMHVKITVDPRADRELEVFAQLGKGGDVATSDLEAICRMVSLWLRAGGSLRHVIKQLEGIGSSMQIPTRSGRIRSLPDGLATALKKYMRAKDRFGLRALLLGEIDLAELDNPHPAPHNRTAAALDQTVHAVSSSPAPRASQASDGNGGSGGAGNRLTGRAENTTTVARRIADASDPPGGSLTNQAPPQPAMAVQADGGDGNGNRHTRRDAGDRSGGGAVAVAELEPVQAVVTTCAVSLETEVRELGASVAVAAEMPEPQGLTGVVAAERHHDAASHYILRCPQCGGVAARQEGCQRCATGCGWGAC